MLLLNWHLRREFGHALYMHPAGSGTANIIGRKTYISLALLLTGAPTWTMLRIFESPTCLSIFAGGLCPRQPLLAKTIVNGLANPTNSFFCCLIFFFIDNIEELRNHRVGNLFFFAFSEGSCLNSNGMVVNGDSDAVTVAFRVHSIQFISANVKRRLLMFNSWTRNSTMAGSNRLSRCILGYVLLAPLVAGASSATCTLKNSGGDDGPAFAAALASSSCSVVSIPAGTTLNIASPLNTITTYNKHISLEGTISFTNDTTYWQKHSFAFAYQNATTFWLLGGHHITLNGGGTIQGQGQAWYDLFAKDSSITRPIPLTIYKAKNVVVSNINILNSPFWNLFVSDSEDVLFDKMNLHSASTSNVIAKNTDGMDIYRSNNVNFTNSIIVNGDDCVSFKPNSTNIFVDNLNCNGSHGVSVGSLGQYPGEFDIVENVTVSNIKMLNAQNGVRIKAWAGPNVGSGVVRNIRYSNWQQENVDMPIIIDSCYMTNATACAQHPSQVPTEHVYISNIIGTSSGNKKAVVVNLNCSPGVACTDIHLDNINLSPPVQYRPATYLCANVKVLGNAAHFFSCTTT